MRPPPDRGRDATINDSAGIQRASGSRPTPRVGLKDRLLCRSASGIAFTVLLLVCIPVRASPVEVRDSQPSANAIIKREHAEYVVRFNGPIDHFASTLEIVQDGRLVRNLPVLRDSAVDVLFASGVALPPGRYTLRWKAVSAQGDVSEGLVPFKVEP